MKNYRIARNKIWKTLNSEPGERKERRKFIFSSPLLNTKT